MSFLTAWDILEASTDSHKALKTSADGILRREQLLQAFKAEEVDLPRDGKVAAHATITLPDDFNSLDFLGSTFTAQ